MFYQKGLKIFYMFSFLIFSLVFGNIAFGQCPPEKNGHKDNIGPTEIGEPEYSDCFLLTLTFDPPLPEGEVDPALYSTFAISINAKNPPPYSWDVEGNGFSLQDPSATGTSNTLILAPDACGAGRITVADSEGEGCTVYVLSSNGVWCEIEHCPPSPGSGGECVEEIHGKFRYTDCWCTMWLSQDCQTYCHDYEKCNCAPRTAMPESDGAHRHCPECVERSYTDEYMCSCP